MRERVLAEMFAAGADLIAQHPEAAAFVCRSVAQVLMAEASRAEEARDADRADMRRRGFGGC